ncbi:MAG: hypothetical protein LBE09_07150 [Christensenellaceae bacterium]|jgi:hypothetical protein|nr:hypothetical protein [Christensenellaceae bacterium]
MFCSKCGNPFNEAECKVCPVCREPVKSRPGTPLNSGQPAIVILKQTGRNVVYKKGHSIILHLVFGIFVMWIPTIILMCNPKKHYWHL